MSAVVTRRRLSGSVALLAAAAGAGATISPDHPDASLLAICASLEAILRKQNSLWLQGVGPQFYIPASYVVGDDARERAEAPMDAEADRLFDQIVERPPSTVEGMRAIARCLVLAECDLRHDPEETVDGVSISYRGQYVIHRLLHHLTGGAITPRTCMDAPAVPFPDEVAL